MRRVQDFRVSDMVKDPRLLAVNKKAMLMVVDGCGAAVLSPRRLARGRTDSADWVELERARRARWGG